MKISDNLLSVEFLLHEIPTNLILLFFKKIDSDSISDYSPLLEIQMTISSVSIAPRSP